MEFDELSRKVIGLAIEVYREFRQVYWKMPINMNFNEIVLKDGIKRFVL